MVNVMEYGERAISGNVYRIEEKGAYIMDENWTKELDGKTPSSDDKELVKRMREEELKSNSEHAPENEPEHVTPAFFSVLHKERWGKRRSQSWQSQRQTQDRRNR